MQESLATEDRRPQPMTACPQFVKTNELPRSRIRYPSREGSPSQGMTGSARQHLTLVPFRARCDHWHWSTQTHQVWAGTHTHLMRVPSEGHQLPAIPTMIRMKSMECMALQHRAARMDAKSRMGRPPSLETHTIRHRRETTTGKILMACMVSREVTAIAGHMKRRIHHTIHLETIVDMGRETIHAKIVPR